MPGNRDEAGRFIKGQSGNPDGRKKMPQDMKKMLEAAAPEAVAFLIETMKNEKADPKIRVSCATRILERAYGKPNQPILHDGSVDKDMRITFKVVDEM